MNFPLVFTRKEIRKAGPRRKGCRSLALASLLFASCACAHLPFRKEQGPPNIAAEGKAPLTIPALQFEVLRFADDYTGSVAHAADRVGREVGTREAHMEALKWKLDQATAAYVDATGPNAVWNALDLVGLATVSRMVIEDAKSREIFGGDLEPLLDAHRKLEASAWSLVGQFLEPSEEQELHDLFAEWRKQNPDERSVAGVHFREFAMALGKASTPDKIKPTSIFSLLYLNPLAGLDPTTVAIEQSKDLAARTVAFAERMPTLLRWQAELLAYQVSGQPEAQQILADANRVSRSAESVAKTAEGLPELVDTQRKEAIDQFFAGVTAQREGMIADLDAHEGKVRDLLGQTKQTLDAGAQMSDSLKGTIQALDAFVHYVSPPPSKSGPATAPGKPFNVLDYGQAAGQVGGMARDLSALLSSVDRTAPQLGALGQRTAEDLKGVVDHAFWRGLALILTLLIGSVPAALAYRVLARKLGVKESHT
ncbi:MAG TPA: hypothetical protein VMR54_15830 [Thermoanaerobaculia bacterium]|nr:hypothetical protein [Thermoanaerobaculia bacterium]